MTIETYEDSKSTLLRSAIMKRLTEETTELAEAIELNDPTLIIDEIVDVLYYVNRLTFSVGLTTGQVGAYATTKSSLREAGVRSKAIERAVAVAIMSTTQSETHKEHS